MGDAAKHTEVQIYIRACGPTMRGDDAVIYFGRNATYGIKLEVAGRRKSGREDEVLSAVFAEQRPVTSGKLNPFAARQKGFRLGAVASYLLPKHEQARAEALIDGIVHEWMPNLWNTPIARGLRRVLGRGRGSCEETPNPKWNALLDASDAARLPLEV